MRLRIHSANEQPPAVILPTVRKRGTILCAMQFNYEIQVEEYAAAQTLYYRKLYQRSLIKRAIFWVLIGLLFLTVALFRAEEFGPVLLVLTAGWFICNGIGGFFPDGYYRRHYPQSGLAGKNYQVELDENGFFVTGDSCSSRVPWTEVHLKAEDKRVFMFNAKATLFIFGKKYLSDEQQQDIRRFAAL